jgi:hypothetical protein
MWVQSGTSPGHQPGGSLAAWASQIRHKKESQLKPLGNQSRFVGVARPLGLAGGKREAAARAASIGILASAEHPHYLKVIMPNVPAKLLLGPAVKNN